MLSGVVRSPSHPADYPNNLRKTTMIKVAEEKVVRLDFTAFEIWFCTDCSCDHLTIREGDGASLIEKSCGSADYGALYIGGLPASSLPSTIVSKTNTVVLHFETDNDSSLAGWSVNWSAVIPGGKTHSTGLKQHKSNQPISQHFE